MYFHGHVGITALVAGPLTALRAHRALDDLGPTSTRTERARVVAREGEYLLITSAATILVDKDWKYLGDHRRLTHSVFSMIGIRGVCDSAGNAGDRVVTGARRRFPWGGSADDSSSEGEVVEEPREVRRTRLAKAGRFLGNATATGMLLHVIGDIPTKGQGGSALNLFWPVLSIGVNMGMVISGHTQLNLILFTAGLVVATAAWATVLPRIIWPTPYPRGTTLHPRGCLRIGRVEYARALIRIHTPSPKIRERLPTPSLPDHVPGSGLRKRIPTPNLRDRVPDRLHRG